MIRTQLVVAVRGRPIGSSGVNAYADLSPYVRNLDISRGKSSSFSDYPVSTVTIEFNNHDRIFDPTIDSIITEVDGGIWNPAEFMGKRKVIEIGFGTFSATLGVLNDAGTDFGPLVFRGYTEDWNLSYSPNGNSIASVTLSDFSGIFSKIPLDADTPSSELSGTRYLDYLLAYRPLGAGGSLVDDGTVTLGTQDVVEGTSLLDYLNLIAKTEGGDSFQSKTGRQLFLQRIRPSGSILELGEGGIGISALTVSFGSELLYNKIIIQNEGGSEITVEDAESQVDNGVKELRLTGLLGANDDEATSLATFYAQKYSTAKLRFDEVAVSMTKYDQSSGTSATQLTLLDAEIGDTVLVSYKPNNIGDLISQYKKIIGITHTINPTEYLISFTLDELAHNRFILDDPIFGRLDTNQLS